MHVEAIERYIEEGWGGRALAFYQTSVIDGIIHSHFEKTGGRDSFAVFATGSYGREEMCPYSDIDILLLSLDRTRPAGVTEFLYSLWDDGLNISHAFRTPRECVDDAFEDIRTRTALLEARFICGDPVLEARFREEVLQKIRARKREDFVSERLREIRERHRKQGNSPFLLQPDLKESKGCLRDIHSALWLASVLYKFTKFHDFERMLPKEDYQRYLRAYDFLLKLRFVIHILSRRKNDRLLFEFQEEAAEMLGIRRSKKFTAVERMMRYFFIKARTVSAYSEKIFKKCGEEITRRYFPFPRKRINADFSVAQQRIIVNSDRKLKDDPLKIFELFSIHASTGYPLSEHLQDIVSKYALSIRASLRRNRRVIDCFLSVLRSGRVYQTLRAMHDAGVLDRLIPEFGSLRYLLVNDSYHTYPVDEHSLICVNRLESLMAVRDESQRFLSDLMRSFPRRDMLYLAVLLHDTGKSKGRFHGAEGYKNIMTVTERLQLDRESRELVEFLVKNHLLMADTAFKHDSESSEVATSFAEKVVTEERLNALYLLTYADMSSVSDHFWTPWRAALLKNLYARTCDHIRGTGHGRISLLTASLTDADQGLRQFIASMPEDYLLSTSGEKVHTDHRTYVGAVEKGFAMNLTHLEDSTSEMTIAVRDREGIFSEIVSVLAVRRLNIIGAKLLTTLDGWAVDRIRLSNWHELWWEGIEQLIECELRDVLLHGKKVIIHDQFQKSRGIDSFIGIDNEKSAAYTVIEIMAPDRLGLLYDITQVFANQKANILNGRIYTEQGVANDIFNVNAGKGKLSAECILALMGALWERIRN